MKELTTEQLIETMKKQDHEVWGEYTNEIDYDNSNGNDAPLKETNRQIVGTIILGG